MKNEKKKVNKNVKKTKKQKKSKKISFFEFLNDDTKKLVKVDFIIIGILVLLYSILAFHNLGSNKIPNTYYHFTYQDEDVGLELATKAQTVSKIRYYTGPEVGNFTIMLSLDGEVFTNFTDFATTSVFAWEELDLDTEFKYIKFVSHDVGAYLGDVMLYDNYGNTILTKAADDQSGVIIDELDKVPAQITHLNSSYFDEIYFARSAYEYTHGISAMEWVHPPLGKLLIAIPVLLFGFNPFAYRLMGTIAGILMIPVIYILAKRLFKNRKWALLAGILMTFDNFHFAHTRMATVDSFLVLFILLAALFMKEYIDLDKDSDFKLKRKNLILSGLFIGSAIATKWTALYAGLAMAIIFFTHLFKQYEDKRKTKLNYNKASRIALYSLVVLSLIPIVIYYLTTLLAKSSTATSLVFWYYFIVIITTVIVLFKKLINKDKKLKKTLIICLISFVLIPVVIYALSYLLFPNVYNYTNNSISGIFNQIKDMYTYHSTLEESHPFQSNWYEWPFMIKPVWYFVGYYGGTIKSTIVGIGNPIIWWFGAIASIFTLIKTVLKREKEDFFISVFILCTFVPYIFIGRAMFLYHYFPTLVFVMLAIVAFIKWITEKIKSNSFYIFYVALVIVIFFVFYPITSGMLTTSDYIDALKWLSSWKF